MFEIGAYVVYGNTGVCRIDDITTLDMPGTNADRQYYVMSSVRNQGRKDYLPVDNTKVVLRSVITRDEALALIEMIPTIEPLIVESDKLREERYKEISRKSDCKSWISIIKTIYARKQERIARGKKVTTTDERYYRMAAEQLYGELAFALEKDVDEVEQAVMDRI